MKSKITLLTSIIFLNGCLSLDADKQVVTAIVPVSKMEQPDIATAQKIAKGSSVFVIYAEDKNSNNISISSGIILTDGMITQSSANANKSGNFLTQAILYGDLERGLINNGFKPIVANLINNDKLYMDSRVMLDRVASLGKDVNATYTLLVRQAYIHYGTKVAYVKSIGCNGVSVRPVNGYIDAVLIKNSTGEVLNSFSYKVANLDNSANSQPSKISLNAKYQYYDYLDRRYFNIGSNWKSCEYQLIKNHDYEYDNLCTWHDGAPNCPIPENTFKEYRKELIRKLVEAL